MADTFTQKISQITYFEGSPLYTPPNVDNILYQNHRKIYQDIKRLLKKELG